MNIATLWIKRKHCEDAPAELIVAWDEYSIEENWQGWRDACARELESIGDDVAAQRFINIHLSTNEIEAYFDTGSLKAKSLSEMDDPSSL